MDLQIISTNLMPLLTGVTFGMAYRWSEKRKIKSKNIFSREIAEQKEGVAKFCEDFALKVLLPFFLIDSFIKASTISLDILPVVILGFLLPIICYGIGRGYSFLPNKLSYPKELALLTSTFGGGNRGMLFLVLLFGSLTNFDDYLKYFIFLDLGNFLFLLIITPIFLKFAYGKYSKNDENNTVTILWDVVRSYAIIALVAAFAFIFIRKYTLMFIGYDLYTLIEDTVSCRKFLLGVFISCAITLRLVISKDRGKDFAYAITGYFTIRLFAIMVVGCVVYFLNYSYYLIVAVIILLSMPPSNLFPGMFSKATKYLALKQYVSTTCALLNISLLLLLPIGILISIVLNNG